MFLSTDQLAAVFTTIFNLSLAQDIVPTYLKKSTIVPIPKISAPACLSDCCPIALTSLAMMCFKGLVKDFICSSLPEKEFNNRSTYDAAAHVLHTTCSHIDMRQGKCARLIIKLTDLGLHTFLCRWFLNFLTGRPQLVRVSHHFSGSLTLNTGAPFCTPSTHMTVWPHMTPTSTSSLLMTVLW